MMGSMKIASAIQVLGPLLLLAMQASTTLAWEPWAVTEWNDAHATFYGGRDASGTMGGACGYGNLYQTGYETHTTALSNGLLNHGLTCGACFLIACKEKETRWCYQNKEIVVTATNACPPGSEGGWCDPPKLHFDLSYPMFIQLAQEKGGVIPVKYKRVQCVKEGGIRFGMYGNRWWNSVLVFNVGNMGAVCGVSIKGEKTDWYPMQQDWGAMWTLKVVLVDQPLSFKVRLCTGQTQEFHCVAPRDWKFGRVYEASYNF